MNLTSVSSLFLPRCGKVTLEGQRAYYLFSIIMLYLIFLKAVFCFVLYVSEFWHESFFFKCVYANYLLD